MNKDELVELLKDEDIRDIIKDIVKDNNTRQDNNEIEKLKEEIEVLNRLVEKWKNCFKKEENKNISLLSKEKQLENEIKECETKYKKVKEKNKILNSKVDLYEDNFGDDLKAFDLYQSLNDNTKHSLEGIFRDKSIAGFMACGLQENNIHTLWDYIQNELRDNKNSDIKTLIEMFDILFAKYLLAYNIFEYQNVNIGDRFDTDDHIRDNSSKLVSGDISQIVFRGWINSKNNKIIKKTIVKVG